MVLEVVGYLAGLLMALSLAPQLVKTWRTKSARDLSLLWTSIALIGLVLYVVYAALNTVMPLLVFAAVEGTMVSILIVLKLIYDRKN